MINPTRIDLAQLAPLVESAYGVANPHIGAPDSLDIRVPEDSELMLHYREQASDALNLLAIERWKCADAREKLRVWRWIAGLAMVNFGLVAGVLAWAIWGNG